MKDQRLGRRELRPRNKEVAESEQTPTHSHFVEHSREAEPTPSFVCLSHEA